MARSKKQKLARRKFDNWMERRIREARHPKKRILGKIFIDEVKESLDDEREKLIFQRLIIESGYSQKDIVKELGIARQMVTKIWKRSQKKIKKFLQ